MLQYDLESQEGMSLYEELARRMRADITSGIIAPMSIFLLNEILQGRWA